MEYIQAWLACRVVSVEIKKVSIIPKREEGEHGNGRGFADISDKLYSCSRFRLDYTKRYEPNAVDNPLKTFFKMVRKTLDEFMSGH